MVDISTNTSGSINVTASNSGSVNVNSNSSSNVNANTNANAQRAKSWAVGTGLIDGEDYSAKYWAGQAKISENIASSAIQGVDDAANQAIEDIETAQNEALENLEAAKDEKIAEIEETAIDYGVDLTELMDRAETAADEAENSKIAIMDALDDYYTKDETNIYLNGKQNTLVSGTNIKTVNGNSLLGSGDINVLRGIVLEDPIIRNNTGGSLANIAREIKSTIAGINIRNGNTQYTDLMVNNIKIYDDETKLIPDEVISSAIARAVNYYTKSETYTKLEVQQLIASIPQFSVEVVQTLPVTGERMVLYLVPKDGEAPDVYNEYIWVEDEEEFELLGTTAVDLSDYVTNSDLATALADYALISQIPTVNNGTLTITQGGVTKGTFTANASNNVTIEIDEGGSTITVDDELSLISENPVQNKVITEALDNKQDLLTPDNAGTDIEIVSGGGITETVDGNGSVLLENAIADSLNSVTLTGMCEQTGTPTPSNPEQINCNNGTITSSKNMFRTVGANTTQGGVTFAVQADGSVRCTGTATGYYSYYMGRADITPDMGTVILGIDGVYNAEGNITVDKVHIYNASASIATLNWTNWTQSLTIDLTQYPTAQSIRVWLKRNSNKVTDATIKARVTKGATTWKPYKQISIDGTVETITDELSNTATAENLFGLANYADTQELLTGAVTRKLGVLILDGNESWGGSSSTNYFSLAKTNINPTPISEAYSGAICTHFVSSPSGYESQAGTFYLGGSYLNINYTNAGGISTSQNMTDFKNWLRLQYANGTPVIVVYPIATETTETVTGQTLTTIQGNNTLTITQASIDNLPIEANYDMQGGTVISFTNDSGFITSSDVGNGTITINQGGVEKGTFTLNQSGDTTIDLDAGGSSGAVNSVNGQTGTVVLTASDVGALADTVTIPTKTSDLTNDSGYITNSALAGYVQTSDLAAVATSGSYNDLINKPTIPSAVTVDQSYDGTSTNAQSGVAIAGAGFLTSSSLSGYLRNIATGSGSLTILGEPTNAPAAINIGVGSWAHYQRSIAIGSGAMAIGIEALQIGYGTNTTNSTLSVGFYSSGENWQLLNGTTGLIPDARLSTNIARTSDIPTATSDLTNDSGYITGITSSDVTTALGYTPYNSANPNGYTSNTGTVTSVNNTSPDSNGNVTISIPSTSGLANTNLSNLSATGKTVLDGQWVNTNTTIVSNQSLNGSSDLTYTLSELPSDSYNYEVLIGAFGDTTATSGNTITIVLSSDINSAINVCRSQAFSAVTAPCAGTVILRVPSNHKIYMARNSNYKGYANLVLKGYRRIGTNT